MSSFGGQNGMNIQNDRTHTERMNDGYLNSAEVSANRRIFLYSVSPIHGTVDLISCCSHEEASVLQWTLLYSPTRRVENDEGNINFKIVFLFLLLILLSTV